MTVCECGVCSTSQKGRCQHRCGDPFEHFIPPLGFSVA
jgi:hypothetical protein